MEGLGLSLQVSQLQGSLDLSGLQIRAIHPTATSKRNFRPTVSSTLTRILPQTPTTLRTLRGPSLQHRQAATFLSIMPEVDSKYATTRLMDVVPASKHAKGPRANESIEERVLSAALICLEGHFTQNPPMGPLTTSRVNSMISRTLEKTHTFRKARFV